MRLPLILVTVVLLLGALVDWYICRAVRVRCRRHNAFWRRVACYSAIGMAAALLVVIIMPKKSAPEEAFLSVIWALYTYFSIYIAKYVFVLIDLLGKIPVLFGRKRLPGFGIAGIVAGLLVFAAFWWGALVNRYNIDVKEVEFAHPALPAAFEGFTIAQLSDMHVGTFGADTAFMQEVVAKVNSLKPDVIVFTGDIVNRSSAELLPFVNTLAGLYAPCGVYSVLGNHDYGDYYSWPSPEDKAANMELMHNLQARMGWTMLNNESVTFYAGNDSLVLVGVENIGDPPFPVYGNLDRAYAGDLNDEAYKVLLSHNPAHWNADIAESPDKNIPLTLSGHTHAMQITILGWSPAVFRYKTWGGMYADSDCAHSLYVNTGIGEVGMPARIGATPEITLITLRR